MPQHRYACSSCSHECVELVLRTNEAPPVCCEAPMRKIMPRRVVGRCVPDSDGAHTGSGFARAAPKDIPDPGLVEAVGRGEACPRVIETDEGAKYTIEGDPEAPGIVPEQRWVSEPHDPDDPTAIPEPAGGVFAKDYELCAADERDARWRDTTEALTAWHTGLLEGQGEAPAEARTAANEASQRTVERARGEKSRGDSLS